MIRIETVSHDFGEDEGRVSALADVSLTIGDAELVAVVGELSGGMQQRVAICRGLIRNPAVLLMDEPFAALDALTREDMGQQLLELWSAYPKTILFVTHSVPEAVMLADRVVVMSARPGRIVDIVNVRLERPRSMEMEADREFQSCTRRIREHVYGGRRPANGARNRAKVA